MHAAVGASNAAVGDLAQITLNKYLIKILITKKFNTMQTAQQRFMKKFIILSMISKVTGIPLQHLIILTVLHYRTFPDSLPLFNEYLVAAVARLYANTPRLISSENKALLEELYTLSTDPTKKDWVTLWALHNDPLEGGRWAEKIKVRRHEIEQLLLNVYDDIPKSTWTDDDRTVLRRPLKSTSHTAAKIMDVGPDLSKRYFIHCGLSVHLHNPLTPETDEMPEYNHVDLEIYIGLPGLDHSTIPFAHFNDVTRAQFLVAFTEGDVNKTAYIRGRFVNSKGEKSRFYSVVIEHVIS
jgi:hypothetical protein